MKGAPGVFTHVVDSFVLVTIKHLSLKHMLGLMDYQKAEQPEPINWIVLFDFDHVNVDRVSNLFMQSIEASIYCAFVTPNPQI